MKLSLDAFTELVQAALADVPQPFADHLRDVVIEVQPMPDRRDCEEVGIDDPHELLGLYHGTPLTERGVEFAETLPDRITIYQRNIERVCTSREEMIQEVRKTVLHEIGHYFGLDEDELEALGY